MMYVYRPDQEVLDSFKKKLLDPKVGYDRIYDAILQYHASWRGKDTKGSVDWPAVGSDELKGAFTRLTDRGIRKLSMDLPIVVRSKKGTDRPLLMVVAMDPLRDGGGDDSTAPQRVDCWVPFSIIENPQAAGGSYRSNMAFFETLLDHYDLYLTDVFKLFFWAGRKKSNQLGSFREIDAHAELLRVEVDSMKPGAVLTLGNPARDAILAMVGEHPFPMQDIQHHIWLDGKTPVVSIPHISGAANGAKAKVLAARNADGKGGMNKALAKAVIAYMQEHCAVGQS